MQSERKENPRKQSDARKRLAAAQLELVSALAGFKDAPDGFNPSRIEATREALLKKRARSVAHAWPRLACALGDSFDEKFASYAQATPIPASGALTDGRLFARELHRANELPDEGRLEAVAFDLRYLIRRDKIITRNFAFRASRLKESRRIIIAIRLRPIGERWLSVRAKIL